MLLLTLLAFQQITTGVVVSKETGEAVSYATVTAGKVTRITDARGAFSLPISRRDSTLVLIASAVGYATSADTLRAPFPQTIRIELRGNAIDLGTVSTTTRRPIFGAEPVKLSAQQLHAIPTAIEPDLLRAAASAAGSQGPSDFSSGLYLSGTTPSATSIVLNGLPLLNPYHLGGIFSAFDPDYVGSLEVYGEGVRADVPHDNVGGAALIQTRSGNANHSSLTTSIGLLSSGIIADGAIGRNTTYISGVRHTYLDLITKSAQKLGLLESSLPYSFTEWYGQLNHHKGMAELRAFAYLNTDRLDMSLGLGDNAQNTSWSTLTTGATVSDLRLRGWTLDGVAGIARSVGDIGPLSDDAFNRQPSSLVVARAAFSAKRSIGAVFQTKLGVNIDRLTTDPDGSGSQSAWLPSVFTTLNLLTGSLSFDGGVRVTHVGNATHIQPDLSGAYTLGEHLRVFGGGGHHIATTTSLRNEESIVASIVAFDAVEPCVLCSKATEGFSGVSLFDAKASVTLSYVKRSIEGPSPALGVNPLRQNLFSSDLTTEHADYNAIRASATAAYRSFDFMLRLQHETLRSASDSMQFTPRYSRPNSFTGSVRWNITGATHLLAAVTTSSGLPYSQNIAFESTLGVNPFGPPFTRGSTLSVLGDYNASRLPRYERVDLSLRTRRPTQLFGRAGDVTFAADIINLFGNRNVLAPSTATISGTQRLVSQAPIIPSLYVQWHY